MHGTEDVEVWGRGLSRRDHWPSWLLLAACMLGAAASAVGGGSGSSGGSRGTRLALGAASGLLLGSFLALEVVPGQLPLQALLVASCLLVMLFVFLLQVR